MPQQQHKASNVPRLSLFPRSSGRSKTDSIDRKRVLTRLHTIRASGTTHARSPSWMVWLTLTKGWATSWVNPSLTVTTSTQDKHRSMRSAYTSLMHVTQNKCPFMIEREQPSHSTPLMRSQYYSACDECNENSRELRSPEDLERGGVASPVEASHEFTVTRQDIFREPDVWLFSVGFGTDFITFL